MQVGILQADGQTEAGATGEPAARRITGPFIADLKPAQPTQGRMRRLIETERRAVRLV